MILSQPQPKPPRGDPAFVIDLSTEMLNRVKGVAEDITARVRHALGSEWPGDPPPIVRNGRPLRVLCVDDHPDSADSLAAVLTLHGCEVQACYDGQTALAAAEGFRPDACVLDLCMPGMDGLELAGHLRAMLKTRPLVLVAATALGAIEERAMTAIAGFHFHLVKPIAGDSIRRALEAIRNAIRPLESHIDEGD